MDLDQQIQTLVDQAPKDGQTPAVVEAIAPVLKQLAQRLKRPEYYVLQTLDQNWVITTLSSRNEPTVEKKVIYAFPTLNDAANAPFAFKNPQLMAFPTPVIHILFQVASMKTVDSTVFFEEPGNLSTGTEIHQSDLQTLVQAQLQRWKNAQAIPPDLA
ncbi:MAG: hypothetical protein IGR80_06455 [Synechococcales cyanobacterium K44_A2020_017]|jgi:hypothetical protein|uniref:hypothetical protein n=1 Tax=Leptolyngbya sp. CCY15150 TaxID=2767772 RepID=UPI001950C9B6|nr:hypothetical protein [Leptolyngbya sp. CCY15150]MBF2087558.1 hypothetical protein [Synechococcales cyanobacterium K32_A2020_035]MBF2094384.1 hypothetical protein [Synechococcales cyanobacterium K44_A2020_017]